MVNKVRDSIYDDAGGWLKEARVAASFSRAALAKEVKLSTVAILRYENGTRNIPFHLIPTFARLLNKEISYFFTGKSDGNIESDRLTPSHLPGSRAFDVLLMYQKIDEPQISEIAEELKRRGLKPWFEKEQVAPGRWIQESLYKAISESKSVAIFIGSESLGNWQIAEYASIARISDDNGLRVIPVFLPRIEPKFPDYSPFKGLSIVRFHEDANEENALDDLCWGITGQKPPG
ncbi:MAG: TIR domain-containing protein [Chloroflexi bacterium]|nr:TIR domain-containing protein [Chloroflexota bacterium]